MSLGPNTNAPVELLAPKCVLCAGEDRPMLLAALGDAGFGPLGPPGSPVHVPNFAYRCYEFWRLPELLLVWSGIGTGCLEPLLWEILRPGVIDQIVLVGTAGRMPRSPTAVGRAYVVSEAWSAGTALDEEGLEQPLRPRWPGADGREGAAPASPTSHAPPAPFASSVSTDFYFGFSPRIATGGYPFAAGALRRAYEEHDRRGTGLVEMEVAPFYAFCAAFPGSPSRFVAAKGVTNTLGDEAEQVPNSRDVIAKTLRIAGGLLALLPR